MAVRTWSGRTTAGVLATLALAALSACGGQALSVPGDDAWVRAVDPATHISAELPGDPEVQTQEFDLPTGENAAARLWMVELGDYGAASMVVADAQGQPIDLAGALTGAAANVEGRVVEQAPASQDGLPRP